MIRLDFSIDSIIRLIIISGTNSLVNHVPSTCSRKLPMVSPLLTHVEDLGL